ncbi:ribosomal protein L24E [Mucor ambiguus]|uniref:Ribosomal protein L24E n=1 Tax=Mucor ambiguus TaxID=91626 RepID=A0A0C9M4W6_9FUNG|nr:ribosomal protein L24E [Mucor ambiguus]
MDFCTTDTDNTMLHSPTSLRLEDLIAAPAKAEFLLELLTPDQISAIEQTLGKVKKRRLNKSPANGQMTTASPSLSPANPPSPATTTTTTATTPVLKQANNSNTNNNNSTSAPNEPVTEMKDGVEWVSFVYSHNRTLKRYSIRTDLPQIDIAVIDDKFKSENCVYPRANLPKEEYHGNRWAYETECNVLGWKLAWLNKDEIAGKRGLIQRAVDSYRNRYPSMRSRRVARQEKLMNGTLRKRKHREGDAENDQDMSSSLSGVTIQSAHHPKTIAIEDANNQRFRIKINVESVDLEEINIEFRKANCPYPRVMNIAQTNPPSSRWLEETMCNELAWKLAWLNPRHLAGKKNMLQRALDIYRSKFMPSLQPRKNSNRVAPIPPPSLINTVSQQASLIDLLPANTVPLTADALSAQNALYEKNHAVAAASPAMSNMSGTTESLDFADCFSLADEENKDDAAANAAAAAVFCDLLLQDSSMLFDSASNTSTRMNSTSSYSSDSTACTPSPTMPNDPFSADFFDSFILSSSTATDDPFYNMVMMDSSASTTTAADLSKLYNTTIEDTFAAGNLLDPLF